MERKEIPLFKVHVPESVKEPLLKTLFSGFIGQGPRVEEFESKLRDYFGNPYPLTLNSGTSGLQLALRLANVGYGDEVIATAMTCTASNMPILAAGAKIVWADIDPVTGNMDPKSVERLITKKTKALLPVHWGGYPCCMDELNAIAKHHGLKVIEDGAHAFGAEYKGKKVANHSDYTMFSLQAIKHVTTIDGGILFCRDEESYKRGKLLRWYGIDREGERRDFRCEEDILEWGYKFHMNDVCATIGTEQLKYADQIVGRHRSNASFYDEALSNLKTIKTIPWKSDRVSAFWLYTIHVRDRDKFMVEMKEQGIVTSKVHARNDTHTTFKPYSTGPLPGVDKFTETMVCIPVGWWVDDDTRGYIAEKIIEFDRRR